MLSPGEIFTLFFVTLGPLKLLGPFAQQTRDLDETTLRRFALRVFLVALIAVLVGGFVGRWLLLSWHISVPALLIATGVIFFLVALNLVFEQYESVHAAPPSLPSKPVAATLQLTFPLVVTPYGIAALIVLLASTADGTRIELIFAILGGVMLLNLLAMLFARSIMHGVTLFALRVLGAVLGVLQVAFSVQIVIRGLQGLGVLGGE
jgi:multiple antibiotic resistance protein